MNPIRTSRIVPVITRMRFRGVLEGAYLLRFLLEQRTNLATRAAMAKLFGTEWGGVQLERKYFELVSNYVLYHHQADFFRYMKQNRIKYKSNDLRAAREVLIRYLVEVQGLYSNSEVVNDLN